MISVSWTISIESLKKNCIKKQTLFGKKEAGSQGEVWFITAVPAVQVFLFSDFILIKGGGAVDFGQAFHCRSPSMSQVPHPTVHPIPFTGSAIFLHFGGFQEKEMMHLAVDEILLFYEKTHTIASCMTS